MSILGTFRRLFLDDNMEWKRRGHSLSSSAAICLSHNTLPALAWPLNVTRIQYMPKRSESILLHMLRPPFFSTKTKFLDPNHLQIIRSDLQKYSIKFNNFGNNYVFWLTKDVQMHTDLSLKRNIFCLDLVRKFIQTKFVTL